MPFLSHLIALRDHLLRIVLTVLIVFLCLFPFSNDLFAVLAQPLMAHLPEGQNMIAIDVASPFLSPLKLTLVLSIYLSMPIAFYHIWAFVAPGLYQHEKRLIAPLLASSSFLFYMGMAFAYYIVFPLVFSFFASVTPVEVEMSTDIRSYLDFTLKMFFAFGLAFEVPIFTILLIWTGFTTVTSLRQKRPYIVVGAFVIGMLLTPPDVFSQTLLAVPMWLLFEAGLFFAALIIKDKFRRESQAQGMSEAEMDAEWAKREAEEQQTKED
jgi:sec-independent protein translocase protein TatC